MLFHIALHEGDDNDNSITRFDREAESKEKLFDQLEAEFIEEFNGNKDGITFDGDENSLLVMWAEYYDANGNELDPDGDWEDDGTVGSRIFHNDYYIETE